jgi:hypothetical protein
MYPKLKNLIYEFKFFLTHIFTAQDLKNLWHQFDPLIPLGSQGFDFVHFSHFVKSTFSEWWVDSELLEKLFSLTDVVGDGVVNFFELVLLLSGILYFYHQFHGASLNFYNYFYYIIIFYSNVQGYTPGSSFVYVQFLLILTFYYYFFIYLLFYFNSRI